MTRAAILLFATALHLSAATVKVQIGKGITELPLEKYVAAVLAGEAGVFRSDEALKAMAVVARTYAIRMRGRHAAEGFDLCATTHCQRLDLDSVTPRLEKLADATAGEMLWYRGKLAFTPYSLDCGGRTESAAAVWPDERAPYLASHVDEYCVRAGSSAWQWAANPAAIAAALRKQGLQSPPRITQIRVSQRTNSGRAQLLDLLGDPPSRIAAGAFRFAIGRELGWNSLRSDWFDAHEANGKLLFTGRGSGHGAGLCQRGADQMGVEGHGYREILAYYLPGTEPGASARGFDWQRLTGNGVTLFTTNPSQDSPVLAAAERALRADTQRTGWTPRSGIEVRLYPDAASFRDATGEPGWVAAYTHGSRIEMQPVRDTEATLRHEFFHLLIESQAGPGLPLWFREGFVEYLDGSAARTAALHIPSDADLRQTTDAARARRTYADAAAAVASLAHRYGETALLRWVKSGIPSSAINPTTNSK
jgi:stage II sporulation protein D (peptidoglycan lytic transglycosylase)